MVLIPEFAETLKDPSRYEQARLINMRWNSIIISYSISKPLTISEIKDTINNMLNSNSRKNEYSLNYLDFIYRNLTVGQAEMFNSLVKEEFDELNRMYYKKIFREIDKAKKGNLTI